MDNQIPPAPPPMQPIAPGNNPYQFITEPAKQPKKSLLGGGSKMQRILMIVGVVSLLIIVAIVFMSIINSAGSGLKNDYQNLVQQQAEIIRVSDIGISKGRGASAKNLAITTKLSLESSQDELSKLAKGAGAGTDSKSIALGKDANTDKELTSAEQANRFDEAFAVKLTELLSDYQKTLKRLYDQTTKASAKATLQQAYNNASILMQNGKP